MIHSEACTNLVAAFEGCRLAAYQDQAGVWSIGFGHVNGVEEGQTCSLDQAHVWLDCDLQTSDDAVNNAIQCRVNQNQFDALVSLCFNIGASAFTHSTIANFVNRGQFAAAAAHFKDWIYAGGDVSQGLVRRRRAEMDLFNS